MGPRPLLVPSWDAAASALEQEVYRQDRTFTGLSLALGMDRAVVARWLSSHQAAGRVQPLAKHVWPLAAELGLDIVFVPRGLRRGSGDSK